jgi:hypothetical protein
MFGEWHIISEYSAMLTALASHLGWAGAFAAGFISGLSCPEAHQVATMEASPG